MNPQLQNNLLKKYPEIFKVNKEIKHPFDQWGIECFDGWFDLIDETAGKIQKILDRNKKSYCYVVQIKEKFSYLRIYISCDNENSDLFHNIISNAEEESANICEKCGTKENVTTNKKGWMKTLCSSCRKGGLNEKI